MDWKLSVSDNGVGRPMAPESRERRSWHQPRQLRSPTASKPRLKRRAPRRHERVDHATRLHLTVSARVLPARARSKAPSLSATVRSGANAPAHRQDCGSLNRPPTRDWRQTGAFETAQMSYPRAHQRFCRALAETCRIAEACVLAAGIMGSTKVHGDGVI